MTRIQHIFGMKTMRDILRMDIWRNNEDKRKYGKDTVQTLKTMDTIQQTASDGTPLLPMLSDQK